MNHVIGVRSGDQLIERQIGAEKVAQNEFVRNEPEADLEKKEIFGRTIFRADRSRDRARAAFLEDFANFAERTKLLQCFEHCNDFDRALKKGG